MKTDMPPIYFQITQTARLPDPVKLNRYKKLPELGPRLLFFSGGTALRKLSQELISFTHNSIHIITPFDSGGSSAELRKAFQMPAVGDIRNRLMALADQGLQGNPETYNLFAYRLGKDAATNRLLEELTRMARGKHPLVTQIPDPMRKIIRSHLFVFLDHMPASFDLKGASIGNLILAAGYLTNRRALDPVIFIFSKLVQVRGIVRPVVNKYRHLVAELNSGATLIGQHRLTGKETSPINAPVNRLYLSKSSGPPEPADVQIRSKMAELIQSADLICYPMGSFYSSLIANILPKGVGHAISKTKCPKIYIPSLASDPEACGLDPTKQTETLLSYLKADAPGRIRNQQVLDLVLVDQKNGKYAAPVDPNRLHAMGIKVIDYPLVSPESAPLINAQRLAEVLLSLT